jgi:hypothetical protein
MDYAHLMNIFKFRNEIKNKVLKLSKNINNIYSISTLTIFFILQKFWFLLRILFHKKVICKY